MCIFAVHNFDLCNWGKVNTKYFICLTNKYFQMMARKFKSVAGILILHKTKDFIFITTEYFYLDFWDKKTLRMSIKLLIFLMNFNIAMTTWLWMTKNHWMILKILFPSDQTVINGTLSYNLQLSSRTKKLPVNVIGHPPVTAHLLLLGQITAFFLVRELSFCFDFVTQNNN